MAITTELELRQFLSSKSIPCDEVELLSGGSSNFCWRIKSKDKSQSIIKHAEPFIRTMPSIPLPQERIQFEYLALTHLSDAFLGDEQVHLPQLYGYFQDEYVMHMSDAGTQDLRDSYKTNGALDAPALGHRLGGWLAKMHKLTSEPETLGILKEKLQSSFSEFVFTYTYKGLSSVLEHHGFDSTLGTRINATFGSESAQDKVCLCHGDFWLPNIQVEDHDPMLREERDSDAKQSVPVLTIIDWESARVGNGATDVGRFAADAWLVDRFHGDKGMCSAFLTAYLAERPLNQRDKIRLTVHFAAHIIFYSRMRWTGDEGTKQLVQTGKEILDAVEAEDWQELTRSPLAQLFG